MTHLIQRSALILLATSALCAFATTSSAYEVKSGDTLGKIAKALGTTISDLQAANGLKTSVIRPGQILKNPKTKAETAAPASTTYTVERGDTLGKIAEELGTTISDLQAANGLKTSVIRPGQVLKSPIGKAGTAPPAPTTYTVERGDTLGKIAEELGTTIPDLQAANGLKTSVIRPGQVLKSPNGKPGTAPPAPTTYTVERGDTLFAISQKLHVPLEALRSANGLSEKGAIYSGQILALPSDGKAATGAEQASAKGSRNRTGAAPSADTASSAAASGRIVSVAGRAATYKVRKGDTLGTIARKLRTNVAQLRRDNRIKGSIILPGQVLKGPHSAAKAYVVGAGDTLAGIAQRFGVSVASLRAENGLSRRAEVRPGQRVRLPAGYRDRGYDPSPRTDQPRDENAPIRTQPDDSAGLPSRPQPYTGAATASPAYTGPPAAPTAAPPPTDGQISQMGRGRFVWPVRGEILFDFGPKATGQSNDGLNIQASTGEPVQAAADGNVVYAGDQVPGFGNMVLIKHADGWVTAYCHLSKVEVKMQQNVTQGQEIGQVGSTGGVSEPQLHFEIRYAPNPLERIRPIDPKLVLPR
jgi:LysM repeat protein